MEDKKDINSCAGSCGMHCGDNKWGGMCATGYCGHSKHRCIRKVLMVIFILFVFCFGMQLGALKGELRATYRYFGMMSGYGKDVSRSKMMWGYNQNTQTPLAPTIVIPTVQ